MIRIVVVLVLGVGLAAPVAVKTAVGQQASGGEGVPGTPPLYDIHEIAPVAGYRLSEGLAITSGGMAAGRSLKYGNSVAFTWTLDGGMVTLPSYPGYSAHSIPYGVNESGVVVGIGASEPSGDNRIPLIWRDGIVDRLPIPHPDYYSVGQAYGINAAGIAVGSVGMGTGEVAVIFDGDGARIIYKRSDQGAYFSVAYAINDHNVIVGQGVDPDDASRSVPFVYDASTSLPSVRELIPLEGDNGGIAFAVSNSGYIAGVSNLMSGSPTSVVWDPQGGVREVPTPPGSTGGVMRGVNDAGWAVGYASSATSVPFLWDGTATYRLQDLIPAGSGWNFEADTAGAAMAITNENVVVGTGNYRGRDRAFVAIPRADTPVRTIAIDVKPGSSDNPLNLRARGVLPVTIPGSAEFRVASIAPATIRLNGVAPISRLYRDADADGILDLELKFSIEGLAAALAGSVSGDPVTLVLTAILRDRSESVRGEDVVTIVGR
ncbi:MAG: hypothetical protein R6V57_13835 [Vicinamibacterales bacterium]